MVYYELIEEPELATRTVAIERAVRILRGEYVATVPAGLIPPWYGPDATAADVAAIWLRMWQRMAPSPGDRDFAFYQAGAIGWSSRP